jgi:probable HAF family extracellular repeat protein
VLNAALWGGMMSDWRDQGMNIAWKSHPFCRKTLRKGFIMKIIRCFKVRSFILAATLFAGLGFVTHAGAQAYLIDLESRTATNLGALGGASAYAYGINNIGQVVGESNKRAFITGPDGKGIRDLGTFGGSWSGASGINDAGRVVGHFYLQSGLFHAFATGPDGKAMSDLGTFGGDYSAAHAINSAGQVVGVADAADNRLHAFITGPDGISIRDLGALYAFGINNAGQVVGSALTPSGDIYPFITGANGAGIRDLGTLGGRGFLPAALDINDTGEVVGYSYTSEQHAHAFITGPDGRGMRDLGTLYDNDISTARAINNAGQVVGDSVRRFCDDPCGVPDTPHAFITGPNGVGMTDLNSLVDLPDGVILTSAEDINNAGQVIANAIPEPQSYIMLLVGLALIGFTAGRKRLRP